MSHEEDDESSFKVDNINVNLLLTHVFIALLFWEWFLLLEMNSTVWFEPTDPNLAGKVAGLLNEEHSKALLTYASPNLTELEVMVESIKTGKQMHDKTNERRQDLSFPELVQKCQSVGQHLLREKLVQTLVITLGDKGVVILDAVSIHYHHYYIYIYISLSLDILNLHPQIFVLFRGKDSWPEERGLVK